MIPRPAPDPDPLEVEMLVPADKRRLTIEEHAAWRETLSAETPAPVDPIDELVAGEPETLRPLSDGEI